VNVTFRLTVGDLVRALRGEAHKLAEEAENRYSPQRGFSDDIGAASAAIAQPADKERSHDRSGR
jgi:hypothetical protein